MPAWRLPWAAWRRTPRRKSPGTICSIASRPSHLMRTSSPWTARRRLPPTKTDAIRCRDPALQRLSESGAIKIAACFPRAVKGLFHQCGADLPADRSEVLNMRVQSADEVVAALLADELTPNLPVGKTVMPDVSASENSPL